MDGVTTFTDLMDLVVAAVLVDMVVILMQLPAHTAHTPWVTVLVPEVIIPSSSTKNGAAAEVAVATTAMLGMLEDLDKAAVDQVTVKVTLDKLAQQILVAALVVTLTTATIVVEQEVDQVKSLF